MIDHEALIRIGARVKLFREAQEFSQSELAYAADVDLRFIQKLEAGETDISVYRVMIIAGVLDIPLGIFFKDF